MKKIMCLILIGIILFCPIAHINAYDNESPLTRLESIHLLSKLVKETTEGTTFVDTDDKTVDGTQGFEDFLRLIR